ncbi:MAG: UvrB/UvrC motif-containing protein [candidate division WOR-3 bacterium]|nr:UvrB/UvrC motif-containing protein [candidate division WOR-3 bacterium]
MKCELCGKNEAKYKYYEVNSDSIRELNICEDCARKKGIAFRNKTTRVRTENSECLNCRLSFKEFKKMNKLGCPECYKAFREKLKIILAQIHPGIIHKGKKPIRDTRVLSAKKEIRELKRKLKKYVDLEDFEDAVKARNKLQKCQEELKNLRGRND